MALETIADISISTPKAPKDNLTVKDVREFLDYLSKLGVTDEHVFLDGYLVFDYQTTDVDLIQCPAHHYDGDEESNVDFVVSAHFCPSQCP